IGEAVHEAEANDPKKLRARIKQLEKELADFEPLDVAGLCTLEEADERVREAEQRVRAELHDLAERRAAAALAELRKSARPHAEALYHALANGSAAAPPPPPSSTSEPKSLQVEAPTPVRRPAAAPRRTSGLTERGLTGAKLKIARGLLELEAIGVAEPSRAQLAFYVGLTLSGGYASRAAGEMKTAGLVEYPRDGALALT